MSICSIFFAGSSSQVLGSRVAELANRPLGRWEMRQFSDGELCPILQEALKDTTTVLIQSTYPPAEHIMELLLMIDAAKNAGARKTIVVAPYLGYMRQDKICQVGEPHSAALNLKLLSAASADHLIVCNPHTSNIDLFFNGLIQQVPSYPIFIPYLESLKLENMCFIAPDAGALEAARLYAQYFNTDLVVCHKIRHKPNEVESVKIRDTVKGNHAILIDDIVDTGNTLYTVAQQIKNQGARSVRALCTHAVLSRHAYDCLASSELEEIIVTNTIPLKQESEKIKVLDIAPCLVQAINEVISRI